MAQSFYTKWQYVFLADAGCYVSREYRNFQTALVREISKYAKAVDAAVVAKTKGHYFTSCFVERNGKFVYINHSSGLSRRIGSVRIELDSFLIRTARHAEDYTGGTNQYCGLLRVQSIIDPPLARRGGTRRSGRPEAGRSWAATATERNIYWGRPGSPRHAGPCGSGTKRGLF